MTMILYFITIVTCQSWNQDKSSFQKTWLCHFCLEMCTWRRSPEVKQHGTGTSWQKCWFQLWAKVERRWQFYSPHVLDEWCLQGLPKMAQNSQTNLSIIRSTYEWNCISRWRKQQFRLVSCSSNNFRALENLGHLQLHQGCSSSQPLQNRGRFQFSCQNRSRCCSTTRSQPSLEDDLPFASRTDNMIDYILMTIKES